MSNTRNLKYLSAAGHYSENMSRGYLRAILSFVFSWFRNNWQQDNFHKSSQMHLQRKYKFQFFATNGLSTNGF